LAGRQISTAGVGGNGMSPLMIKRLVDRTVEKARSGGLPPATANKPSTGCAYGLPCIGCGECIEGLDENYLVNNGGEILRFHEVCYKAWAAFEG
jgi:hypothetical protein